MQLQVDQLRGDGRTVRVSKADAWALAAAKGALEGEIDHLEATLVVHRPVSRGRIVVEVTHSVAANRSCDRCGEALSIAISGEHRLEYMPAVSPDVEEVELGEDELDLGWYMDGVVALDDVLSEALALSLPDRVLCTDTAACDARTAALVAREADNAPTGHPAFAALKNFH